MTKPLGHSPCWQCGKPLTVNKRTGVLVFVTIGDQLGNPVRVHLTCQAGAKYDIKKQTAAPTERPDGTTDEH